MSVANKLLEETLLTSTKHRFLEEELTSKEVCSFKTILKSEIFTPKTCLTENRILLEEKKDYVPVKKKKKLTLKSKRDKRSSSREKLRSVIKRKKKNRSRFNLDHSLLDSREEFEADEEFECGEEGVFARSICIQNSESAPTGYASHNEALREKPSGTFGGVDLGKEITQADQENVVSHKMQSFSADLSFLGPYQKQMHAKRMPTSCSLASRQVTQSDFVFGSAPSFDMPLSSSSGFSLCSLRMPAMPAGGFPLQDSSSNIPEIFIPKMPTYSLEIINLYEEKEYEFSACSYDSNYDSIFLNAKRKKMKLLNVISMALMFSSNLRNESDNYRVALQKSIDDVMLIEPEFILKVALYSRQELQIRTVSNFLLSSAAVHENARMYLEKYFSACIVLPSDWIEVAEYFQILSGGRPFPATLRRAMKKCFEKFDKYQLAKYNRTNTKKKQPKETKNEGISADTLHSSDSEDDHDSQPAVTKALTLKKLIGTLHIGSPSENVMCLLEKKYPQNQEEFRKSGLPGVWDPKRAGQRMKLPTPETWETRISACGNTPAVWESLIDNNKLPYMATLRNLRNLILSGISTKHHKKLISNLQNKKSVINSRQLPMQYFEAYKVLTKLQKMIENGGVLEKDNSSRPVPAWQKVRLKKMQEKIQNASLSIVEDYKTAVNKALEISSMNNLHPIPGKTLIICQLDQEFDAKAESYETCIMMGLMCLKACEDCKMCICCNAQIMDTISLKEEDPFLDALMRTVEKCQQVVNPFNLERILLSISAPDNDPNVELNEMLNSYLRPQSMMSLKMDHLVFIQMSENMEEVISSFLHKYRQLVNPDLLYTHVNFNLNNKGFSGECFSEKDAIVCGSSSSLIKFIAERSTGGQLNYVQNIDVKYKLEDVLESKYNHSVPSQFTEDMEADISNTPSPVPLNYRMPTWRTLRIFISSTFKDMMSERDILIRYVFPELKKRAASVFAKIVEVDLRWGITEADSATKRAAEICLIEAQKADIFVGLIGERYGTIYNFEPPDAAELQWVKDCPKGLSITELEIEAAALRKPQKSRNTAIFYFRNNSFIKHVPKKWVGHFVDFSSRAKVEALKEKIWSKKFKIFDGYPCHFAGICDNKPVLGGLDVLGNRVLDDLWKAVQEIQKTEPRCDTISDSEICDENLLKTKEFFVDQKEFSSESIAKKIGSTGGISLIYGVPGCGKTTFLINLVPHLKSFTVLKCFIGISPRSRDMSHIIQYLCQRTCQELGSSVPLPSLPADIISYFPDFLLETSKCCGGREIIFLIDGLDRLDENDQRLDWLPLLLPKRIRVICSASQTSLAFKVLCDREKLGSVVSFLEMPPLLQPEREQIIRNYLSDYRKALDEKAFSNKMLKIVTKKDSSIPFYLHMVCDFLRIYGSFENLESILQSIPSSIDSFFQEIIIQMENEYGSILIQTVLALLCLTKEGLEDADLHPVLSFATFLNDLRTIPAFDELKKKIASLEPENLLSQVTYCSLMSTISTFAHGKLRQESFNLVGTEFEKAIKKFYRNKNLTSLSKSLHCILAAYYSNVCDVTADGTYKVRSGFDLRSLLYHMLNGGLYKELVDLLCNVTFLKAVFLSNADSDLLEYYSSLLYNIIPSDIKLSREIDCSHLSSFYDFVSRNFHIFHQYPDLLIQQAVNELSSLVDLSISKNKCYLLEHLSRASLVDYRLATLGGFTKNITAAAGENLDAVVVLGTEDGYIKILDLTARRVIRTIKAHASEITYISCMEKNRMCVSSNDGTLSVWNTQDFSRISVLHGHRHNVTCCCFDPAGYLLYSSGWDNSVRLWSVKDGRSISAIEDFRCPVNWIDHHPQKQQIACGLWNGNIEIWDTVSIQKKKVMISLNGSVQSLAYTQDGINIVSSYINSDIFIWSSEEGLKMSSLKGHVLPVKTLTSLLNDSMVISGSDDCTLKIWSTTRRSHFTSINDTKFCPIHLVELISENLLAVAFQNGEIWVFDINNGKAISTIALGSDMVSVFASYSFINNKGFENDFAEKCLVFGTQSGQLMLGDVLTSSASAALVMHSKVTAAIHNCKIVVCGTSEGDIGIYDPQKKLVKIVQSVHKGFIGTFCLFNENKMQYLLASGNDNILKLWKVGLYDLELTFQNEFLNKHRDAVTCAMFHTTQTSNMLTGSYDNTVILWEDGSTKVFQGLQSSVLKIACSGDYILGCGNDGALVMWHKNGAVLTTIPGLDQSSAVLTFHVAEVDSGEFAVTLAYVDLDGSIKISKPLQLSYYCSLDGHRKPITSCCGTENKEIVSCSLDGCVNLWKVPVDVSNAHFTHESSVTGLILSASSDFALSSDAHGNLILWKIGLESSTSPLTYAGKKKYDQGFIKGLSWLQGNKFACAVSQLVESGERNFLDIIGFNDSPQKTALSLQVKKSYTLECEISCLDTCEQTDTILVGTKSGHVIYIANEVEHRYKMCDDWILGLCFYSKYKPSDRFSMSSVDGRVKMYSVQNLLTGKETILPEPMQTYEPPDSSDSSKFTSVMCCAKESICCGDSDGVLRIYAPSSLKFTKKIHDDLISGMCIIGSYLFTSSLDKTVKGWNLTSFKQVCQFHSSTPVTCLSTIKTNSKESSQQSNILLFGTTSGSVHILQFHTA